MKLAAIVLAAGQSRRFGSHNKLHSQVGSRPMLAATFEALSGDLFSRRIAVIDPADRRAAGLAREAGIVAVENPDCRQGMGTSIARGIEAVGGDIDAAFIFLGDMPFIARGTIDDLAGCLQGVERADAHRTILVPQYNAKRGHPVVFGAAFFAQLASLKSDTGARAIISLASSEHVIEVEVRDPGILEDIDLPEDLPGDK